MNHQEKLKTLKNVQELIIREFGRRIERAELISLTSTVRIAVDFLDFLSNTETIANPSDQAVADMHEVIHSGLDSIYTLRRINQAFPRKKNAQQEQEYTWPACPDFNQYKETCLSIFEKLTDVNIGAESRLGCLMDLARLELIFLGKTL